MKKLSPAQRELLRSNPQALLRQMGLKPTCVKQGANVTYRP